MLLLILKSSACLAVFMLFYKFFLEKESFHVFKRYYLLGALIVSIIVPNVTFINYVDNSTFNKVITTNTTTQIDVDSSLWINDITVILWWVYCIGVLIFTIRFIKNLIHIYLRIKQNQKSKHLSFINVLLKSIVTPHTFFNYIFLNKEEYENSKIPEAVLIHEQAHAKQKHSVDIIILELLQIIFWFNPLVYILKHTIKLNHEFLADIEVINCGVERKSYQKILLAFSSNVHHSQLANAINYSLIKKRFTIMKTQTSKSIYWGKILVILPLLALIIYSFSGRTIIEKDKESKDLEHNLTQQKASKKEVAEYNKLAKYYNGNLHKKHITIKMKDVERLKYLYNLMSSDQRKSAEPFPNFPEPPPVPKAVEIREVPPPPPPIPANATTAQRAKYEKVAKEYKAKYNTEIVEVPPPPAPPKAKETREIREVPPPPPPLNMNELAKKGAIFYYEGKKIPSKEALKIYKNNKELNIQVKDYDSKQPIVKISKEPIKLTKKH